MKASGLPPSELQRGRKILLAFTFFNVLSFLLIGSNLIILYALKLGANNFIIGLLSSFLQIAYLFMLLGRNLIKRMGAVKLFGIFWTLRYILMLPVLSIPLIYQYTGNTVIPLAILIFSVLAFNISRGIAITSYNPIIGELAGDKDRANFLSKVQIINHLLVISTGVLIAFYLGKDAPIFKYTLFIAIGIVSGIIGSILIFKLPEPLSSDKGIRKSFRKSISFTIHSKDLRRFFLSLFISSLAVAMLTPFVVVYFKNVYGNSDSQIIFFTVAGGFGALVMALINGFIMDRIGAKPLNLIYSFVISIILIPMLITPTFTTQIWQYGFACLILFFTYMGTNGIFSTNQVYFFSLIKPEERLNLGILYFLTMGISGTIGSLLGGSLLEGLQKYLAENIVFAFRAYFAILLGLYALTIILILMLKDVGAYTVRDAIGIIFSPRDLRAIGLLNKLGKSHSLKEERSIIQALGISGSVVTKEELLARLKSPSFAIRAEALNALNNVPIDEKVERALVSEIKNHHYTTAYLAAEIIGKRKITSGIKPLIQTLNSKDYFLVGKSMVALARLNVTDSIPKIIEVFSKTTNPRLIIHGAWALQIFRDKKTIPALLDKLKNKTSPFVRDEIILSIAGILDLFDWFYPLYTTFLESANEGIELLLDKLKYQHIPHTTKNQIAEIIKTSNKDYSVFSSKMSGILDEIQKLDTELSFVAYFKKALKNETTSKLERFRFLISSLAIALYRRALASQ